MLRITLLFLSIFFAGNCLAQVSSHRQDSVSGGRLQVIEHGSAVQAVSKLRASSVKSKVLGYRVRIFFDNSQTARARANETISRFREMFPDISADLSYRTPYWEVSVGRCATNQEAVMLKGKIESSFSGAIISREEISISKFAE